MDIRFPISLPPGVVKNDSAYASKGRWVDSNFVRSWMGRMQKWLGWGHYASITLTEPARGGLVYNTNDGNTLALFGTANKLWLIKQGVRYDITPQGIGAGLVSTTFGDVGWGGLGWGVSPWGGGFSSVSGQGAFARVWTLQRWGEDAICCPRGGPLYVWQYNDGDELGVTMTGDTHTSTTIDNLSSDDTAVGMRVTGAGIPVNTFVVTINHGANSATISNAATATATGVSLQFDMPAIAISTLTADALLPSAALGVLVTDDRHLVVFGAAQTPATYDPVNIAWCDREDYTVWTPTTTNTAGAIRCESGNQIMGVTKVFGGYLFLTDLSAHPFTFVGGDDIWGLDRIGSLSGAIAPLAMTEMDGVAYWMGFDAHYTYNGRVNKIPCDVHAHVFGNLNRTQAYKIIAGTNRAYNEVIFFWGDLTGNENRQYHAINLTDSTWSRGESEGAISISRTTWIDTNALTRTPLACDGVDYKLHQHDSGTLADGVVFSYSLESGEIELNGETWTGDQFVRLKKVVPDYATDGPNAFSGQHALSIDARAYPSDTPVTKGPYDLSANRMTKVKARGRHFRFAWSGTGNFRMGDIQAYGAPDGGGR